METLKQRTEKWVKARRLYEETTESVEEIARRIGVSGQAVHNRKKREGWKKTVLQDIKRRTHEAIVTHGKSEDVRASMRRRTEPVVQVVDRVLAQQDDMPPPLDDVEGVEPVDEVLPPRTHEVTRQDDGGELDDEERERLTRETVADNVAAVAAHALLARTARAAITVLMQELIHDTQHIEEILNDIEIDCTRTREPDPDDPDPQPEDRDVNWRRMARMQNAVSLTGRTTAARNIAMALKTVVEVERVALGIDEADAARRRKQGDGDTLSALLREIDGKTLMLPSQLKRRKGT